MWTETGKVSLGDYIDPLLRWVIDTRARRGILQVELGKRVGLKQGAISKVLRRKQHLSLLTARDLVEALDYELVVVPGPTERDQLMETITFDAVFLPTIEHALRSSGFGLSRVGMEGQSVRCWSAV